MSDQLKMHSPNLVDTNIEKIAALFPNCVTEAQGENGELKKAIDFDLLKQELSQVLVEGEQERYRLDWVGKKESILTANAPIAKTLRPCREESVNFDTTENLFIEGDNLEALKLLQENYLGKVKMIYIDPPYNTGNESWVYNDNVNDPKIIKWLGKVVGKEAEDLTMDIPVILTTRFGDIDHPLGCVSLNTMA